MEFYRCKKCGSIVFNRITKDGRFDSSFHSGIENISNFLNGIDLFPKCCGEDTELLIPNSIGASPEKHIPQIEFDGSTVKNKIGKESHPMTEEHHIDFIIFETLNTRDQAI